MTAERIAALPDDDWRKHDARFQEPAALAPPGARRAPAGGRRAPRHDRRGDRGGLDAAPPGGATARSSASAGPTRSSRWRSRATSSSPTRTSPRSPATDGAGHGALPLAPGRAAGGHLRHAPAARVARRCPRRASSACARPTSSCTPATSSPRSCSPTCARSGRPVEAVHGNVDDHEVAPLLPSARMVSAGGARIAMVHDAGPADGRLARLRRALPRRRRGRLRPLAHPAARARRRDGLSDLQPRQPDRPAPPADAHDGPGADRRGWRGELRADRPRVNVAERVQASIRAVNAAERDRSSPGRSRSIATARPTIPISTTPCRTPARSSGTGSTRCARPSRRRACGRAWSSSPSARRGWRRRSRPTDSSCRAATRS